MRLRDATVSCSRVFDIADSIDLERCRSLIESGPGVPRRLTLQREGSAYIQLSNPPLVLELGTRTLLLGESQHEVTLGARIFDHGALSVMVRVPVASGTSVEELIPFVDGLFESPAIDQVAFEERDKLRDVLSGALEAPHSWEQDEEYTVIFVKDIEGAPTAAELLAAPGLARLLLGEVKEARLSTTEEREVLNCHFSYTERDLAIIEWNAAFIYEPSGSEDIIELLEVTTAQLLELRYYDAVLDRELGRLYDAIGQRRGGLLVSPYKKLLHDLMLSLIELSEFIERAENALKIIGDVYLARVYEGAVAQFRVRQWAETVTRKHRLLQQVYGLLKGEVDTARSLTLELMIVGLILFEIVMALLRASGH